MESMVKKHKSFVDPSFWFNKKVFITGHTGFKGSWLSLWLSSMGAKVFGYSLSPTTSPNLYSVLDIEERVERSVISDVRDLNLLNIELSKVNPDIAIHMAAQPLVHYSYKNPVETYSTNVMGVVNFLESLRATQVQAAIVVTSDKCYNNTSKTMGYDEEDPMGGFDPYSSSKGCAELIVSAYRNSFFSDNNVTKIASVRSGNVIGGGDWSENRLVPDAIKAFEIGSPVLIRSPNSIRPWQYVLEPLSGYLILCQKLYSNKKEFQTSWNFGPSSEESSITVKSLIDKMIGCWGEGAMSNFDAGNYYHEAAHLTLNCRKAAEFLDWTPTWDIDTAIKKTIEWHKAYLQGQNMQKVGLKQIFDFCSNGKFDDKNE